MYVINWLPSHMQSDANSGGQSTEKHETGSKYCVKVLSSLHVEVLGPHPLHLVLALDLDYVLGQSQ